MFPPLVAHISCAVQTVNRTYAAYKFDKPLEKNKSLNDSKLLIPSKQYMFCLLV